MEPRTVHVYRGRVQHVGKDTFKTLCGRAWVAVNVGPPATEKPMCPECEEIRRDD